MEWRECMERRKERVEWKMGRGKWEKDGGYFVLSFLRWDKMRGN